MSALDPPARVLDLSRLVSRQGRAALTGVDRVELAYLRRFLAESVPVFGLVRTGPGVLLLDRAGVARVLSLVQAEVRPAAVDLLSRLTRGSLDPRAAAETWLRQGSLARAPLPLCGAMLRRHLPEGSHFYLVGHSDLERSVLAAMRRVPGARVTVLLHDAIPLDHPEFSRPGAPARFRRKLDAVSRGADRIMCTTRDAAARVAGHLARLGRVPPITVAPLGIDCAAPDASALPEVLRSIDRFFLCVGTIEPRKNHALLLDLWERMHATLPEDRIPRLVLAGSRGWMNAEVFCRLDNLPFVGRTVLECPGLGDGAVAALMQRARALLHPSKAEGFGLPPAEALAVGLPVIASPLAALREVLGDLPHYAAPDDVEGWLAAVLAATEARKRPAPLTLPGWDDHFNLVLNDG